MKLTKVKVVAMVVAPLLSGLCVVAAAHYLMSGLEPPRIKAAPARAATACVPRDVPVYHTTHHGHRPPGNRREGSNAPSSATEPVKQIAADQNVANHAIERYQLSNRSPAGNGD